MWNQLDYRGLEGFVYAVTPFNFTSIAGNLPTAPALMGNTVIWKPASSAMVSAYYLMKLLEEAGLPPGVINFVPGDAALISDTLLSSRDLAGVHFTGSTAVFNSMWKTIGASMSRYKSYPRIVGETGGKDFIVAHASADPVALSVAIARGGFEYQGQKCSAASRVYIPESLWPEVRDRTVAIMKDIRMGDVTDFRNFMGAVIDASSFKTQKTAIDSPLTACGIPIAAASTTAGCATAALSTSAGPRRLPATLIVSSERPCRNHWPSSLTRAKSPCWRFGPRRIVASRCGRPQSRTSASCATRNPTTR